MMQLGVVFPQTEIGNDPSIIRDYAQTAEGLGYSHILAYDHVLGASVKNRTDWRGPYTSDTPFHEPFVLFGYMASITERVGFTTGVIILPQRQTALVAKQAAQVDLLSGGRLRLGVGIGWNEVEYEALGEEFGNRGRRMEEQVELLRRLWTEPVVDFTGRWHRVPEAGINPLPVQRPIPVWIGGGWTSGCSTGLDAWATDGCPSTRRTTGCGTPSSAYMLQPSRQAATPAPSA
jgi:probable F420-dependent oxidoreductase